MPHIPSYFTRLGALKRVSKKQRGQFPLPVNYDQLSLAKCSWTPSRVPQGNGLRESEQENWYPEKVQCSTSGTQGSPSRDLRPSTSSQFFISLFTVYLTSILQYGKSTNNLKTLIFVPLQIPAKQQKFILWIYLMTPQAPHIGCWIQTTLLPGRDRLDSVIRSVFENL